MTKIELLNLIHGGENIRVEFKKSTNEITKDVYDTVCSFSNRDGGIIVLGVKRQWRNFRDCPGCGRPYEKGFCHLHQQRTENQPAPLLPAVLQTIRGNPCRMKKCCAVPV